MLTREFVPTMGVMMKLGVEMKQAIEVEDRG